MKLFATSTKWLFFAVILLGSLLLSACTAAPQHEWTEAPGWSRARLVGETHSAHPVQPALDGEGNSYFATSHIEANVPIVRVTALDASVESVWQVDIELERLRRANKPSILLTNRGLEVFWLFEEGLFSAILSTDGEIITEPRRVSGNRIALDYVALLNKEGESIVWFGGDRSDTGVYAVDGAGNISSADPDGYRPQIVIDGKGQLHATWLQSRPGGVDYHLYYAMYPDSHFIEDQAQRVYTATISVTSGFFGPEIGVDEANVYLFWSEISRTGLSAGQVDSLYITFPYGGAEISEELDLPFPNGYNLNYGSAEGVLNAGERAHAAEQSAWPVPDLTDIYASTMQSDELVIVADSRLPFLRNKLATQVGLVFLDDGKVDSYQLLSFTPALSELPSVQSDAAGDLHATWLEKKQTGEYRLYYSTTAAAQRSVLDELDSDDAAQLAGESVFGLLSGAVLIPLPILWALGPMVVTFLAGALRKENEAITAPGTLITILVGGTVYWFAKLFTLPGMFDYIPFSAWIPILPESWYEILRIGVPMLTAIVALFFAYRLTYGKGNRAPLFFMLFFALIDGVISIAIYGVLFYNAF